MCILNLVPGLLLVELFLAIRKVNNVFLLVIVFFFFWEKAIYAVDLEKNEINFHTPYFYIHTPFSIF